jgi:hypothetical protein
MKPAETHRQRFKPSRPTRRFMACTMMDSTVFRVIHFLPPLLMADALAPGIRLRALASCRTAPLHTSRRNSLPTVMSSHLIAKG